MLLLHPKRSSLRDDRSINLNLSDHVHFFAGKYDDRRLQNKERINVLIMCDAMREIRGKIYSITLLDLGVPLVSNAVFYELTWYF